VAAPTTLVEALAHGVRLAVAEGRVGAAQALARMLAELLGVDVDARPWPVVDELAAARARRAGGGS